MKKLSTILIASIFAYLPLVASISSPIQKNVYSILRPYNDSSYSKTNDTVSIQTESGHKKGVYAVYLHQGKKYIKFNNTWICIHGKSRFAYNGNWYVIK